MRRAGVLIVVFVLAAACSSNAAKTVVNGYATAQLAGSATRADAERLVAECGDGDAVSRTEIARGLGADGRAWSVEFDLHGSPGTSAWADVGECVTADTSVMRYEQPVVVDHGGEPGRNG